MSNESKWAVGCLAVAWLDVCYSLIISLSSKQIRSFVLTSCVAFGFGMTVCVVVWKNPSDVAVTDKKLFLVCFCFSSCLCCLTTKIMLFKEPVNQMTVKKLVCLKIFTTPLAHVWDVMV